MSGFRRNLWFIQTVHCSVDEISTPLEGLDLEFLLELGFQLLDLLLDVRAISWLLSIRRYLYRIIWIVLEVVDGGAFNIPLCYEIGSDTTLFDLLSEQNCVGVHQGSLTAKLFQKLFHQIEELINFLKWLEMNIYMLLLLWWDQSLNTLIGEYNRWVEFMKKGGILILNRHGILVDLDSHLTSILLAHLLIPQCSLVLFEEIKHPIVQLVHFFDHLILCTGIGCLGYWEWMFR